MNNTDISINKEKLKNCLVFVNLGEPFKNPQYEYVLVLNEKKAYLQVVVVKLLNKQYEEENKLIFQLEKENVKDFDKKTYIYNKHSIEKQEVIEIERERVINYICCMKKIFISRVQKFLK